MTRIFHPWDQWECVPAGMYETTPPAPFTRDTALRAYAEFLGDTPRFATALARVLDEWPRSCEQFLSNPHINRIAWLGQASMCLATRVPSGFRAGFMLLGDTARARANTTARAWLRVWLQRRGDATADFWGRSDTMDSEGAAQEAEHFLPQVGGRNRKIAAYIRRWRSRGYPAGIPDAVPPGLMHAQLAPSYRAICVALLKNDMPLQSLGFIPRPSPWYGALKRIELAARPAAAGSAQMTLPGMGR